MFFGIVIVLAQHCTLDHVYHAITSFISPAVVLSKKFKSHLIDVKIVPVEKSSQSDFQLNLGFTAHVVVFIETRMKNAHSFFKMKYQVWFLTGTAATYWECSLPYIFFVLHITIVQFLTLYITILCITYI
jgi:hypothetical protein